MYTTTSINQLPIRAEKFLASKRQIYQKGILKDSIEVYAPPHARLRVLYTNPLPTPLLRKSVVFGRTSCSASALSSSLATIPQEMDQIQHKFVPVRELNLHIAEIGTGDKVVIFLHGFPEIWYSWRHQMIAAAKAGFRAIAIDHRGYGLSDSPAEPEKATMSDFIEDLHALLDSLKIDKAVLVAKDFGTRPAYFYALVHPERVLGVVSMGVPHVPPGPAEYLKYLPEGFYMNRWQTPGRAEADFGRFDVKTVIRNIYVLFSGSELPIAAENQEIMDVVDSSVPLPPWFTEEDLAAYASLYEKSGFRTALKVPYRSVDEEFNIVDPIVKVPTLFIMGGKDYFLKFPGMADYVKGQVKHLVPDMETVDMPEGSHFVQEQFPEEVNKHLITFLNARIWA